MHGKKMANSNGDDWSKGGWTGQGSWPWLLPLPPFYDTLCFLDVEGDDDDAVHELEHLSYYLSWMMLVMLRIVDRSGPSPLASGSRLEHRDPLSAALQCHG